MRQIEAPTRSCGTCRACCKPWTVPEVGKHDAGWCQHSCATGGCKIYDQRPPACSQFTCLWLANDRIPEKYRPDLLGVMIDYDEFKLGERNVGVIHFWEMEEYALQHPYVRIMVKLNMESGMVVIMHSPVDDHHYSRATGLSGKHFSPEETLAFRALYPL